MTLTQVTTGGVDENINIDSNTLKVDGINNRVGIGTASPSAALEVVQTSDMAVFASTTGTNNSARFEVRSGSGTTSGKYAYVRFNNNDTNNQRYDIGTYGTDNLTFRDVKAGSTRMTLDTSGRLLVGTTTKGHATADLFTIASSSSNGMTIRSGSSSSGQISFSDGTSGDAEYRGQILYDHGGDFMRFRTAATEQMRIDSSGRLLVGTNTSTSSNGQALIQAASTSDHRLITAYTFKNDAHGPFISLGKSRGTTVGSYTVLQDGDELGSIGFFAADGTDLNTEGARIQAEVSGTPGTNDMPTRLIFAVTADGANGPTERMRIDSAGHIDIDSGIIAVAPTDNFTLNGKTQPHYGFNLVGSANAPTGMSGYYGIAFATDGSEAMRIDRSGRVLIGTTSGDAKLEVRQAQNTTTTGSFTNPHVKLECLSTTNNSGFTGIAYAVSTVNNYGWTVGARRVSTSGTDGAFCFRHHSDSASGNERMRITSAGKLLLGAQSALNFTTTNGLEVHSSNNGGALILRNSAASSGRYWRIGPETNNTLVLYNQGGAGQYMTNGGSSWNSNASDLRVKDVVGDLNQTTSWNVLKGLQIKKFWFKNESTEHRSENTPHVGPIAQELHALDPNLRLESPSGTTAATFGQDFDGPVYTYDNDLLLKHALSALNQAIAKIETLETKVAALEAAG